MGHKLHSDEIQDEVLEVLWIELVEGGADSIDRGNIVVEGVGAASTETLDSLLRSGFITVEGSSVQLTNSGFEEARKTIRRHRLSERLFLDIFDVVEEDVESVACRFEHLLIKPALEEKICELLGHPKTCPHNRTIPVGDCCLRAESQVDQTVVSMSQLRQGEGGAIAYVHSGDSEKLKKLMAMGILPGAEVILERRVPSFVFNVGFSRYAVDEGMASAIFVKRQQPSQE